MLKTINFENIHEYNLEKGNTNSTTMYLPKDIADGKIDMFDLNSGLMLYHHDFKVNNDFVIEDKFDKKVISFTSFLNGKMKFENKNLNINKIFNTNFLVMNTFNCQEGLSYYKKGDYIKVISISMDELFLKNNFCTKNSSIIDNTLNILNKNKSFSTINESPCNFTMLKDLNDLLNDNLNDSFKKLYLQSKVYEFLYINLNLIEQNNQNFLPQVEQEYLLKVKDYILQNLYKELSIKELAKVNRSNETKFQKNFKIFFKTTVFKYILDCRMKKAKELLETNDFSISQIASMVGYKYQSNFSSAFYKKFEVLPKDIMKVKNYHILLK